MRRIRTGVLTIAAAALGSVGSVATARGGDRDPDQVQAVEAIERAGGWVCPPFLLIPQGCVVVIQGSKVTDDDLAHLKYLEDLRVLAIDDTKVTGAGLAHLDGLKHLNVLSLEDSEVTDAGLAHIKGLKNLRELDLKGTQVTDAGLDHLKDLKRLRYLSVAGTRITAEGKKKLRRSLPWCRIR